jgi:hypothetical protein
MDGETEQQMGASGTNGERQPPVPATGAPPEIETLQKYIRSLDERVALLESQRERNLQFSFQSILVLLTVLTLAIGVPFSVLYGTRVTVGILADIMASALVALVALVIIWLLVWWRVNVPPVRSFPDKAQLTSQVSAEVRGPGTPPTGASGPSPGVIFR